MKRKFWLWIGGGVLILILFIPFLSKLTAPLFSSADHLTEKEAQEIASQRYSGTVQAIQQAADEFVIRLERDTGLYELIMNAETGEVSALTRLEKEEVKGIDEETAQPPMLNEAEKVEKPPKRLTEQDAAALALEKVPGTIDDIDFEMVKGIAYYFVEVETNDDRDATVQIHAITGEVKSLTWDDDD